MLALACWSATCTGRKCCWRSGTRGPYWFSTLLVLVAGMLIAIFVVKFGNLDVTSAYLATSPGGLNVVVGLAADMGPNAPIVLAYQMVRLYTIILTVPLAARILHKFLS